MGATTYAWAVPQEPRDHTELWYWNEREVVGPAVVVLIVVTLGYWAFQGIQYFAYTMDHPPDEIASLKRWCDGDLPRVLDGRPSEATCRTVFHWWQGPTVLTVGVLTVATLSVVVYLVSRWRRRDQS